MQKANPLPPTDEEARVDRTRTWRTGRILPLVRRGAGAVKQLDLRRREIVVANVEEDNEQSATPSSYAPLKIISFLLIVVLPFIMSLYYFIVVATDQYTAEARFAVRSLADQATAGSGDSGMLSMEAASQDAYVVTSFIQSPELLNRLGKSINFRAMFARDGVDWLSRSETSESTEEFLKYWKGQVSAYIDGPSGIITLKVRTFRPEDSRLLAEAIVTESEQLINELNSRAQRDLIESIRGEVERSGRDYTEALAAINRFRINSGLLSPEVQATETGKLLSGLLSRKLELETRMFVLKQSGADNSPVYEQLQREQSSLEAQVAKLRSELTGSDSPSIAQAILGFSKLDTDRLVAEKLYETARSNYDAALAASMRKALYLTVFVHPSLPQEALYPKRLSAPLIIGLGLLLFWATLMLLWASVEDHRL